MDMNDALEYIFGDTAPDGTFKAESLEMHRELKRRKELKAKKHKQDFDDFKVKAVSKALKIKRNKNGCRRFIG